MSHPPKVLAKDGWSDTDLQGVSITIAPAKGEGATAFDRTLARRHSVSCCAANAVKKPKFWPNLCQKFTSLTVKSAKRVQFCQSCDQKWARRWPQKLANI